MTAHLLDCWLPSNHLMQFKLLYPSNGVHIVNPNGRIVIITLWTPPENVSQHLSSSGPVAAVGGLYGGGFNTLLRNLLYNPQIDTVIIFGKELGDGSKFLMNYFNGDIIHTDQTIEYKNESTDEKISAMKVYVEGNSTKYILDPYIHPDKFPFKINCVNLSTTGISNKEPLLEFISDYHSQCYTGERIISPNLIPVIETVPNNIFSHSISRTTILDAWEELLFKLNRFGKLTYMRNDKIRKELINMKIVINDPTYKFDEVTLKKYGLDKKEMEKYSSTLISSEIPEGQTYSYGNRLTAHFHYENNLTKVIKDLSEPGDRRRCYVTLWDNTRDITSNKNRPCMTSLWFRKTKDKRIHLTVTFRTHNGALAWAKNAFGLADLLKFVCACIYTDNYLPGTLTIISNSISLDPNSIAQVSEYIQEYKDTHPRIVIDQYGFIKISIDNITNEIVACHFDHDHNELARYTGKNPQIIQNQLYVNQVISDIGHAMYVGTQLEKAYVCLTNGLVYEQDKKIVKL